MGVITPLPVRRRQRVVTASRQLLIKYRAKFGIRTDISPQLDRPLIAQLCGSDMMHVVETALALEQAGGIDGIDINCGCPQQIAKRGHYGAFLLEDPTHLLSLVKELSARLSVPVSVKVRLLPNLTMIFPTWRDRWPCTDNSLTPAPPC